MRLVFSFLVLAGLIVSLNLVDLFYDRQQQMAKSPTQSKRFSEQIAQGTDPSLLLKPTAAGDIQSAECEQNKFYFGSSANGYPFVKEYGGGIYVAQIDDNPFCLKSTDSSYFARKCKQHPEHFERFKGALLRCLKSSTIPASSGITFKF